MSIEEGEEVQVKGMRNIFNKIITENFPNLEKSMPIHIKEVSKTPNRPDQNRTTPQHIVIKITNTETRERILKAVRLPVEKRAPGLPASRVVFMVFISPCSAISHLKATTAMGQGDPLTSVTGSGPCVIHVFFVVNEVMEASTKISKESLGD
jgi:hypothetical protein